MFQHLVMLPNDTRESLYIQKVEDTIYLCFKIHVTPTPVALLSRIQLYDKKKDNSVRMFSLAMVIIVTFV